MERLLEKLNRNMEMVLKEVTNQGKAISELSVKVDVYSKRQEEISQDLRDTDRVANDALTSTKSAHKRLDKMENQAIWMKRTLITTILGLISTIVGAVILAFIKL